MFNNIEQMQRFMNQKHIMTIKEANEIIKKEVESLGCTFVPENTDYFHNKIMGFSLESIPNTMGHEKVAIEIYTDGPLQGRVYINGKRKK